MPKNTLQDLRDHLFASLEDMDRLDEEGNVIYDEAAIKKAEAVAKIGKVIMDTAKAELSFLKMKYGKDAEEVESTFIGGIKKIN